MAINRLTKSEGMTVTSTEGISYTLKNQLFKVIDSLEDKPNNKVRIHIVNEEYDTTIWPFIDSKQDISNGNVIEVSFYIDNQGRMICHGYEEVDMTRHTQAEVDKVINLTSDKKLIDKPQEVDIEKMETKLNQLIEMISNKSLKLFTKYAIEKVHDKFIIWPAAVNVHHNIKGGLLLHSVNVAKNAYFLSKLYSDIDVDLVIMSALLHDIGKIFEYTEDAEISELGQYADHITLGLNYITKCNNECENILDTRTYNHLYHIILSHHGKLEWGSPRTPATKEAFIVHQADYIDTNMYIYHNVLNKLDIDVTEMNKYIGKIIQTKLDTSDNYDIN